MMAVTAPAGAFPATLCRISFVCGSLSPLLLPRPRFFLFLSFLSGMVSVTVCGYVCAWYVRVWGVHNEQIDRADSPKPLHISH